MGYNKSNKQGNRPFQNSVLDLSAYNQRWFNGASGHIIKWGVVTDKRFPYWKLYVETVQDCEAYRNAIIIPYVPASSLPRALQIRLSMIWINLSISMRMRTACTLMSPWQEFLSTVSLKKSLRPHPIWSYKYPQLTRTFKAGIVLGKVMVARRPPVTREFIDRVFGA